MISKEPGDRDTEMDEEIMRTLIGKRAQLGLTDSEGATPLHLATRYGKTWAVRLLIEARGDVNCLAHSNESPLILAAEYGHIEVIQMLLDAGTDVNYTLTITGKKWTALRYAACYGHADVVRLLLDAEAIAHIGNDGETILHTSAFGGNLDIVKLFLTELDIPSAVATRNPRSINTTLLNASDDEGRSVIHLAARRGHTFIFDYLLECGVCRSCRQAWLNMPGLCLSVWKL